MTTKEQAITQLKTELASAEKGVESWKDNQSKSELSSSPFTYRDCEEMIRIYEAKAGMIREHIKLVESIMW